MVNHILELDYKKNDKLKQLFKSIAEGNSILFLGAGASVTEEKRFLSNDIIEFYEDKKGISLGISDIIEFVDAITSSPEHSRDEFDNYVDQCLRRLKITPAHLEIAKVPWRLIITTNYDELVEKSFTQIMGTHEEVNKLKVVRSPRDYRGINAADETKFVKLHGCISDKRNHRLVFSTDDFKSVDKFYKEVLNDLRNISDNVSFLSIGYSYSDLFAKKLLDKIDSYGFRQKRTIFNVDPYVNPAVLPLFADKNICVVKSTMNEFFDKFNEWKNENEYALNVSRRHNFTNSKNADLYIPTHIAKRVNDNLKQLNFNYRSRFIPETQFYKGEEPDYGVILRNYDVIKHNKLQELSNEIKRVTNEERKTKLIPIIFLTGTFGSGKSTFAFRLLNNLNNSDGENISFEIADPASLNSIDLKEIFSKSTATNVFLYIDTIEVDTVFKSFLDLRNRLSIDATPEYKIAFIATVRENILLKLKEDREIKNSYVFDIDCKFNRKEIEDFVEKLRNSGTLLFRDINEKNTVIDKVLKEYNGDSYISLLELVQGNKLIDDLLEAYYQLNEKCKKAFLYTSLLYQYKILMPAGLLNSLISNDWEDFRKEVIEKDGRGILIQEIISSRGTEPDLYFRTKHPIISKKLIQEILRNEDIRYNHIKSIVTHIIKGAKSSRLVVNFLKALSINQDLISNKINTLYDLADKELGEDQYFLLHYVINLQHRQNEDDIINAIERIQYAESSSDRPSRNHYLIHRRGVLSFELAKIVMRKGRNDLMFKVYKYINEARDFLDIKRRLDPFSSYSYYDLIKVEIWCLDKFEENEDEKLLRRIHIEELFDISTRVVYENAERIFELRNDYLTKYKFNGNEQEYLEYLFEYYEDSKTRPYALILLFNHFLSKAHNERCNEYLYELESLILNNDVRKLLLKYYGRNLFDPQIRIKFFRLIKDFPEIEDDEALRYYYYNFIAESYNKNFRHAHQFLVNLRESYSHINPDFNQSWIDYETGEVAIFDATLKINNSGKKLFYIPELNQWLKADNWNNKWELNRSYKVHIHFYIYGLRVEVIGATSNEEDQEEVETDETEL